MLFVFVEEGLDPLVLFEVGQLGRVRKLEKGRSQLDQPLWVDSRHGVHVLLGGLHNFVVHHPLGLTVEQRAARVNGHDLRVDQGSVPLLRVLLGRVPKEAGTDGLLDAGDGLATGNDVQLVPVHDPEQLLSNVLRPLQRPHLDKIFETPRTAKFVVLP